MTDRLWEGMGLASRRLHRRLSTMQLLGLNVGAMVGTGWVVAATKPAGDAAVGLSWLLGTGMMFVLALVCAELAHSLPTVGGNARYSRVAFGRSTSILSAWSYWLGTVGTTALEALVATRSLGALTGLHVTTAGGNSPSLNALGLAIAAALLAGFAIVNVAGIGWLGSVNGVTTVIKVAILLVTAIALATLAFSHQAPLLNLVNPRTGEGLKATFIAVASSGIIFALLGFEQPLQFAAEALTPRREISRVVLGSVWLVGGLYLLLQVTFFGAGIAVPQGGDPNSPFEAVAAQLRGTGLPLFGMLLLLYGVVGTAGTGLIYLSASGRLSLGAALDGSLPRRFTALNDQRAPYPLIVIAFASGLVLLAFSQQWTFLLRFTSSAYLISLGVLPLVLAALRRTGGLRESDMSPVLASTLTRRIALDGVPFVAFVVANLLVLFSTWEVNRLLLIVMPVGVLLFALLSQNGQRRRLPLAGADLRSAWWLLIYLPGIGVVSALSSFGGSNWLTFGKDMLAMVLLSAVVYVVAVRWCRLPARRTRDAVQRLRAEDPDSD